MAEDISMHLEGLLNQMSESLTNVLDRSHQKLMDLTGSSTAEQVHQNILHGFEQLSSSLHQTTMNCVNWFKAREQRRKERMHEEEQMRKFQDKGSVKKHPWRWTFANSNSNEQQRNCQRGCHEGTFPTKHIRSIQNWVAKIVRR